MVRRMAEAYKSLPEEKKKELDEWERANLDGHMMGTSDWPGWEELIEQEAGRVGVRAAEFSRRVNRKILPAKRCQARR